MALNKIETAVLTIDVAAVHGKLRELAEARHPELSTYTTFDVAISRESGTATYVMTFTKSLNPPPPP